MTLSEILCDRCQAWLKSLGLNIDDECAVSLRFTEDDLCRRCVAKLNRWMGEAEPEWQDGDGPDICDTYNGLDDLEEL
jgi:hypothetical protein